MPPVKTKSNSQDLEARFVQRGDRIGFGNVVALSKVLKVTYSPGHVEFLLQDYASGIQHTATYSRDCRLTVDTSARTLTSIDSGAQAAMLREALRRVAELPQVLANYERTGDHDHSSNGTRPLPVGASCPGGDCDVARARAIIKALEQAGVMP